ncbi:MAG: hypothetical protein AAF065_12090 [Verrucomicrobiota bacterium]
MLTSIAPVESYKDLFKYAEQFMLVGKLSLSAVLIISFTSLVREMGKSLVEKLIFKNGLRFPTTEMLLWKTRLISKPQKEMLHRKILEDFEIELYDAEAERDDELEARLRARDAVSAIRHHVGDGKFTLQYNIRYGFWRNLVGGLPLGLILGASSLLCVESELGRIISGVYLLVAIPLTVLGIPIIRSASLDYAHYLFTEYGGKK